MNDKSSAISGTDRAAIFMMSLGEQGAAEVLKHMAPKDVQKIGTAMAGLQDVPKDSVKEVLGEFAGIVSAQSALSVDTDSFVRNVLTSVLGENKAGGVIDQILDGSNSKGLESLKWMAPSAVAEVIKNEHPQIIAIVLASLEHEHAAEVLNYFSEDARPDILIRIATLDGVSPTALQELNEVLEKQFSGSVNVQASGVGGIEVAAGIMNFIEAESEAAINEAITREDQELAQNIQDLMFVFENLLDIDDRGIQKLLRDLQSDTLIIALKGSSQEVKEKIFKNMSSRASEMMQDDLEAKGPVRLQEVEDAQKEILEIARRMAESGDIVLGGKGGEEYV